ncbi:ADP-dependent NAD(P)H-hydrate dehydratase [Leucobacter aridicollis]|uniref:ADP-dependent NAD(P)H-hydrate dehydratase n=1 Tax=Leucobacter aridicollis TaxID=283878 RepID=UPI002168C8BB|nr:ADP/ATP-dependent (S)-NAD(P)H-hydrate dehydratase [Leucobacter aridicollis]MCS3427151.1 hydroxyethylthiazole kinase-like uncharacterized protein yjeF [Leucobacter aridicollis]
MHDHTRWTASDAAPYLTAPTARDHKYSRGVLGVRTGSAAYPGAATLGVEAAWRTGVGLVQFAPQLGEADPRFGLPTPAAAVLATRPETVVARDASRATAWLIGSGTDPSERDAGETEALTDLFADVHPLVVDAGALELCLERRDAARRTAPVAITPHAGEFARLWRVLGAPQPANDAEAAAALAARLDVTVLLKGSVTTVASPVGGIITVGPATPWLATAGTGDVLAGILGALAARHAKVIVDPDRAGAFAELCATAAMLHDTAARLAAGVGADTSGSAGAAGDRTRASGDGAGAAGSAGRPIVAGDVARHVPAAVEALARSGG